MGTACIRELIRTRSSSQLLVTNWIQSLKGVCIVSTFLCAYICDFMFSCVFSLPLKVKVKVTLVQELRLCTGCTAHRRSRGIALPFHDQGTRRGWGVSVTPRPLFTPGKDSVPIVQRLGGPQGRSGQVRKISSPPGFDRQAIQPVASHYTDHATRPTHFTTTFWYMFFQCKRLPIVSLYPSVCSLKVH